MLGIASPNNALTRPLRPPVSIPSTCQRPVSTTSSLPRRSKQSKRAGMSLDMRCEGFWICSEGCEAANNRPAPGGMTTTILRAWSLFSCPSAELSSLNSTPNSASALPSLPAAVSVSGSPYSLIQRTYTLLKIAQRIQYLLTPSLSRRNHNPPHYSFVINKTLPQSFAKAR